MQSAVLLGNSGTTNLGQLRIARVRCAVVSVRTSAAQVKMELKERRFVSHPRSAASRGRSSEGDSDQIVTKGRWHVSVRPSPSKRHEDGHFRNGMGKEQKGGSKLSEGKGTRAILAFDAEPNTNRREFDIWWRERERSEKLKREWQPIARLQTFCVPHEALSRKRGTVNRGVKYRGWRDFGSF
jgi:hypothetical protein